MIIEIKLIINEIYYKISKGDLGANCIPVVYGIAALILSYIPVNSHQTINNNVATVYIHSNGVHLTFGTV
ncbi:hypothetical protein NBRC110019_31670 [Neptunitalea chrysea]|uniref:Uncharacterized protein n=1 Tax=Neptunitalea chrysea TaxID=1647581 RepID=A0A9W6EWC6_9FLAO|nr:hypothetical protein NBRC110019_31670 [Neptunitalea chrysea]